MVCPGISNEPPILDGGSEKNRPERQDIPACDIAHVDDPVRSKECVAEVDELVDEVVHPMVATDMGKGKVFAYEPVI
jgi:hypothetical protein